MSDSLWLHGLQHTRLPYPSLFPGVCTNLCTWSPWCHLTISSSASLFFILSIFPSIRGFSNDLALHIRWPKYWSFSFSISPSNESSGLISFRTDWFDLLAVQGTLESSSAPQFKSINSSVLSLHYGPTLTSVNDPWKIHSLNYMDLCWQSDVFAF